MFPAPLTDLIVCAAWGLAATAAALAFVWSLALLARLVVGPPDWAVVGMGGVAFAIHQSRLIAADVVIRDNLSEGRAKRMARRLRQTAEDTPERIGPWED